MRIFLFIALFFVGLHGVSQEKEVAVFAAVKNDDTGKKLSGAIVEIYSEGKLVQKNISAANGKVPPMYIETGKTYRIYVKKSGYVTKMAEVNTSVKYLEDAENLAINFLVSIFESVEGVDFSYLETTPMTKFYFDDTYEQAYDEAYTEGMLRKIEELKRQIREKKEELAEKDKEKLKTEADFQAYVDAGDAAMAVEKYERAVDQYTLALGLKKDDKAVKTKLEEAQRLLDAQRKKEANQQAYIAKMAEGLAAFKAEEWEKALGLYKEAAQMMPGEQAPLDKIKEIEAKIAEEKALLERIKILVADGDKAVTAEEFDLAISKYTEAQGLKSSEEVQAKIDKAKELKAAKAAADKAAEKLNQEYEALMKSGENLLADKKYESALEKFTAAQGLKPEERIPAEKIKEINDILSKLKADEELNAKYEAKMEEAQAAFDLKDWENALNLYKEASSMKELETKPKAQIKAIEAIMEKEKADLARYQGLIGEGDQLVNEAKYEDAIAKYEEAKQVKNTPEVEQKISDAQKAIADLQAKAQADAELEQKYKDAISAGDSYRDQDQLEDAINSYNEALKLKAGDEYAQSEIDKINKIIADRAAESAAKKKAEAAYQAIIDAANKLLATDKLTEAKAKYNEALEQRPDDQYPKDQIKLIDKKLDDLAKIEANNKAYDEAIKKGEKLKGDDKLQEAIGAFQAAQKLKPEENLPQVRIDEINKILADRQSVEDQAKEYAKYIQKANELRDQKQWEQAKENYKNALNYKPDDTVAPAEISKIDKVLAEQKASEAKALEFKGLVDEGNLKFDQSDFEGAITSYRKALEIRDDDAVKAKIKAAEAKINEQKGIAAEDEKFNSLLEKAGEIYASEDWERALEAYKTAQKVRSTPEIEDRIGVLEGKLANIKEEEAKTEQVKALVTEARDFEVKEDYDKALKTYQEAYAIKPDPELEQQISQIKTRIEQVKAKENLISYYESKIAEADILFNSGKWVEAISIYQGAKAIKSDETYPDQQIKICRDNIKTEEKEKKREEYDNVIAVAQNLLADKKYDEALSKFEEAKRILPLEEYPDRKIEDIKKIQLQMANEAAGAMEEERLFNAQVKLGDEAFDSQNFDVALVEYNKASELRPTDPHVTARLKETKKKLEVLNKAKKETEKYKEFVAKGDQFIKAERWEEAIQAYKNALIYNIDNNYIEGQIEMAEEAIANEGKELSDNEYQELLNKAQAKFDAEDYEAALTLYKQAYLKRQSDDFPARKISEINQILDNLNKVARKKNKHKELVDKADVLFEKKQWQEARALYEEAYGMENDAYSDSQIKKIKAINDPFLKEQYDRMISKADEYFNNENYEKARELYKRAIKTFTTKNTNYPKAQVKKINQILNPPELLRSGNVKPVGNQVTLSEEEIERMFADADAERIGQDVDKIINVENTAGTFETKWLKAEELETFEIVNLNETATSQLFTEAVNSGKKINDFTDLANELTVLYETKMKEEDVYTENIIFRQTQVLENTDREINESTINSDQDREDFENTVLAVQSNLDKVDRENTSDHNNVVFKQVDRANEFDKQYHNSTKNIEVGRKNMELEVENVQVNIVNAESKEKWKGEDNMHGTVNTLKSIDEQNYEAAKYDDLPRQNMEVVVTSVSDDQGRRNIVDEGIHDDVINKTNNHVATVESEIIKDQENAGEAALAVDEIRAGIEADLAKANSDLTETNEDQIYLAKQALNEMDSEQFEMNKNKTIKQYKDNEAIQKAGADLAQTESKEALHQNNERHMVTDFTDKAQKQMTENSDISDEINNENTDVILRRDDRLKRDQISEQEKNEKALQTAEDLIINISEIDIHKIDQKVKNELGTQFPEGVTQEVYEQKDDNGLLLRYVIRRIVVSQGEGNVFEKTKTKFGISYTKNGHPITAFTWENETESAGLIYH